MKNLMLPLALAAMLSIPLTAAAGPRKSTGGATKQSPTSPTVTYNAQEAFNQSPDKGVLNYQDQGTSYDADIQCVVVSGSTVYFAAEIIRSTVGLVGSWVYVVATDNGEPSYSDTIGYMVTDMTTALDNCANQEPANDSYTVQQGNITTK